MKSSGTLKTEKPHLLPDVSLPTNASDVSSKYQPDNQTESDAMFIQVHKPSTFEKYSLFGQVTHLWLWKFFWRFWGVDFKVNDLYKCPTTERSKHLTDQIEREWQKELVKSKLKNRPPSLVRVLVRIHGCFVSMITIFCVIAQMMQVVQGWLLGMLIDDCRRLLIPDDATDLLISNATSTHNTSSQAENSDSFRVDLQVKNQIFLYCVGLVCAQMVYVQFINVYNFYAWRVGVRIRTAVGALIYRKALRLSSGAFRQTTPGQVVTMLTNDLMKIEFLFFFLPYPLLSMLITALVAILMYMYMGWLCLIAPALLAVYIPFQVQIGRLYQRFRRQSVRLTDERLRLMGDFLPAMRLIKMYAWEPQFARLIALARRREVSKIRAAAMLTCFNHGLFYVMGKCIVFVLLICWLLFGGGQLSAQLVFVTATLVGKMAIICGLHFPLAVMQIAHSQVAIRRLTRYFLLPEQSKTTVVTSAKEDDRTADLSNTACGGSWPEFTDNKPTGAENEKSAPDGCCGPTCVFFVPPPRMSSNTNTYPQSMPARLRFESITATYDEPIPKHTGSGAINKVLQEVSFEARDRTLTVVVGAVGAGKSSLLLCTLNELHVSRGQVHTNGRVSYAAQESWIFTGTVRDNILFGLPLCPKRYLQVIRVCALRRDLRLFSNGDQTLVGERGVSLSGGQRARLSLARALYRPADVYLLDDPLSAVDAHVAKHVYHQALRGFLRNKCVMLVTHQLQVIADAEQLILMRKGRIRLQGEFCTVVNQVLQEEEFGDLQASLGQRLSAEQVDAEILSSSSSASSTEEVAQEEGGSSDMTLSDEEWAADIGLFQSIKPPSASSSQISLSSQKEAETIPVNSLIQPVVLCASSLAADVSNKSDQPMEKTQNRNAAKVPAENCELSATWKAYRVYLKLGLNWWFAPLLVIVFCGTQALYSIVDYWMSLWTDSEERLGLYQQQLSGLLGMNKTAAGSVGTNESHWPEFEHRNLVDDYARGQNVLFYSIQMGLLFSLSLLRTVLFFVMCMKASVRLHDRLFERVIRAPVSFFDQNPVGILLNRVSRDLGIVDENMPIRFYDACDVLCVDISIVIMISLMNIWLLIPFCVLCVLVLTFRSMYLRTARRITILESTLKSPIIQHLSSSLSGLVTIRAFNAQSRYRHTYDVLQNDHMSAYFTFFCSARWFVGTVETIQVLFIAGVAFTMATEAEHFNGSSVGLIIYSAILFCSQFQWMVKNWTEVETQMISVDRLNFYSTIPSEAALYSANNRGPPSNWPTHGRLRFERVTLRYETCPSRPVLRSLSFTIEPGQKIGIVGRTGAGKSSLIAALFRLCEVEGHIWLDNVDCASIGLHELRRRLSIIPQEPLLFTGTVRSNLDPFDEHSDDQLWHVLRELQLHAIVQQMPGGLQSPVSDGATAFSVGQKQLLCLARAMLRDSRVLVLDEATANCDPLTDQLIQKTIRKVFAGRTILIVAHRLQTIIDADRVLLIDAGQLVEFDSPARLLAKPESHFSDLVRSTGAHAEPHLKRMAYTAFEGQGQAKDEHELNWIRSQLIESVTQSISSDSTEHQEPTHL